MKIMRRMRRRRERRKRRMGGEGVVPLNEGNIHVQRSRGQCDERRPRRLNEN